MKPYLVLLIFGAWSGICWRWYVCGIKQQCAGSAVETPAPYSASLAPEESTYEPRDVDSSADAAPAQALAPNPASAYPAAADEKATDKVQIVNAGDATLIHFPYNSVRREDNESIDAFLNDLAAQLIAGGAKVKLTGHTDFVGTAEKNKKLGLLRAQSIRDALVKRGVPASQIICRSMGERKPIGSNDYPGGRYKNRRVEIQIVQ